MHIWYNDISLESQSQSASYGLDKTNIFIRRYISYFIWYFVNLRRKLQTTTTSRPEEVSSEHSGDVETCRPLDQSLPPAALLASEGDNTLFFGFNLSQTALLAQTALYFSRFDVIILKLSQLGFLYQTASLWLYQFLVWVCPPGPSLQTCTATSCLSWPGWCGGKVWCEEGRSPRKYFLHQPHLSAAAWLVLCCNTNINISVGLSQSSFCLLPHSLWMQNTKYVLAKRPFEAIKSFVDFISYNLGHVLSVSPHWSVGVTGCKSDQLCSLRNEDLGELVCLLEDPIEYQTTEISLYPLPIIVAQSHL